MSSFINELENLKQAGRYKDRIIMGLFIGLFIQALGWSLAPSNISLHYPPDLRSGATMGIDEIPPSEVYLFAQYMLQQLYTWEIDGEQEYASKISVLRSYFTPQFSDYLRSDYDERKSAGELRGRVRQWSPIPGRAYHESYVELTGDGWLVWLDTHITEYVRGSVVKNLKLKIPILVVRHDVDREKNPWGIALHLPGNLKPRLISESKT